jgi:hypothetical protein
MNNTIVTIEAVQESDYESWMPLWGKYQEFYNVDLSGAVTQRTWQRFFSPIEPLFCVVARYNGEVVGFAHYLFHRSTWRRAITVILKIYMFAMPSGANTLVNS